MPHIDMPFIGVHLSPTVDDKILLGPNAVPILRLDGYKQSSFDFEYVKNHVLSKGFGLLFIKNFQSCLNQVLEKILSDVRTSTLNKYFPMLSKNDILPGPTAVQGQIVTNDGEFVDDFLIEIFGDEGIQKRIINCRFVPSPGATCSLAIAEMIYAEIAKKL
ncbi:hypothetical protein Zmor_011416 [Zophobas morio]|uniref:FAD dependent oxidoreductase domain-containing protein n=1 Tax=Zophobas morio TaxID=2755281 RepID=A0AA38IKN5_9CUCU|nr:hypothetical protein Zmor_011416 [Zophobas morio]